MLFFKCIIYRYKNKIKQISFCLAVGLLFYFSRETKSSSTFCTFTLSQITTVQYDYFMNIFKIAHT